MSSLVKKYRTFKKDQEGTATVEFVLLFPAFMFLFFMGFESGYYMVRSVMLERAVDVAVRDVRLNNGGVPELGDLKDNICGVATILPDCRASLQVEILPIAPVPGGVAAAGSQINCIDKSVDMDDPANATVYNTGSGNQLMLVRVCALAMPMFPTTGIGAGLRHDSFGNYAMVATSAFVNEPGNSTEREEVVMGSGLGNGGNQTVVDTGRVDAGRGNGSEEGDPGQSETVNQGGDEGGSIAGGSLNPGNESTGSGNASTTGETNGGAGGGGGGGTTGGTGGTTAPGPGER